MRSAEGIKITKDRLIATLLSKNGLFCDHIPYCFSTTDISLIYDQISSIFAQISTKVSFPLCFTMSKKSILRRTISVPNLISYIKLLEVYKKYWDNIRVKAYSKHSESQLNKLLPSIYQTRFADSIKRRNNKFVGFKVKLNLDISNFFDSIYTHSITWALVGKTNAKKIFNHSPDADSSLLPLYNIGGEIDDATRIMNGNQTNGILTGPYGSNIFSEIILAEIDRILEENKFEFTRFVDDFSFYFFSRSEAEGKIDAIAKILKEYNLIINTSKISIEEYPYDLLDDFSTIFQTESSQEDIVSILHKALNLYKQGKSGAIKYALVSLLQQGKMNYANDTALNIVLNIILNFPELSRLGIQLLEQKIGAEFIQKHAQRINNLLERELELHHEHESLWLLFLITKLELPVSLQNISNAMRTGNDLLIILCLDIIHNNISNIYYAKKQYFKSIIEIISRLQSEIDSISNMIKNEDFTGTHWLLAYEVAHNNWRINNKIKIFTIKSKKFYQLMSQNDVKFYNRQNPAS